MKFKMDKCSNTSKLDALKRRRDLLASLAARRRLMQSSSTPKHNQEGAANTVSAYTQQDSSLHSHSSDVVEESDIELEQREKVVAENRALKHGRALLPSLAACRRLLRSSSTPKHNQEGAANTVSAYTQQDSSLHSHSSDVVEESDIELEQREKVVAENRVVYCSDNSNDSCNTSTFSLPLAHPFFGSTLKSNETASIQSTISKSKVHIISDIVLVPPTTTSSHLISTATVDYIAPKAPKIQAPAMLKLLAKSAVEKLSLPESNTAASLKQNIYLLDNDNADQSNLPPVAYEVSIPNQQPVTLSPPSSNHMDVYESLPGPSTENINMSTAIDTPKGRKRHFRRTINKAHVDYLSDEEQRDFSAGSSDLWSNRESDASSEDMTNKKKKKKTKKSKAGDEKYKDKEAAILIKKKEKRCNVRKIRKNNKSLGKAYETRTGVTVEEKKIKENPCTENKCVKRCFEITEERRNSLFNHFWGLDSQRRRDWILRCIQRVPIKRKRTSTPESRRTATYEYFINDGEDHRKVCQKFLMYTLDITQKYITYTIRNSEEDMAKKDMRKPNVPQKYSEAIKQYVTEFIEKLPVLPSHYNRPKTGRLYLPQEYKSTMHIYRKYLTDCRKNGYLPVSESIFRQIFNEYDISIHVPKKDKCKICTEFENNKDSEKESNTNSENSNKDRKKEAAKEAAKEKKRQTHLEEKDASYRRFQSHQNIKLSNDTITTSFDLQKVLNTPYGESMLLYYSRKYAVYNLTFYESGTQDAFCYTWGESDGNRGSNEIATCLLKYLKSVDSRGVKNLLLYCDSCGGQNKNKTVLAALNYFLKTSNNLQVIQINFLLPGHTYMPVDSVHAVIEREVKKLIVWSPSQWPTYFQTARKNPRPYQVEVLDHTDFLDFEELAEKTFTPLVLKQVRVQQIRIATFKKKYPDQIILKYSMVEETEEIKVTLNEGVPKTKNGKGKGQEKAKSKGKGIGKGKGKGKGKSKANTQNTEDTVEPVDYITGPIIKPAYNDRLPISLAKYNDLKRLCDNGTIPKTYHEEYRRIPYEETVRDYFPLSDDDDDQDIDDN